MPAQADDKNVLAIIGTPGLAKLVECSLAHPDLRLDPVSKEKQIVAALAGAPSMVLVGGRIGRRGPLVLCDAVRLRNADVPIVVLLGGETDDEQLDEHRARKVGKVQYLDLRDVPSSVGRGARIRNLVLAVLHIADDPTSAQNWPRLLRRAERNEAAPDQLAVDDTSPRPAGQRDDEPVPPPIRGPLTAEDLEFADRMVAQTRNFDLRSPAKRPSPRADAGDTTTVKLREKVRDLERRLARLAHIYRGRNKDFEASDQRTTDSSQHAETLATELSTLLEQSASERAGWERERSRLTEQTSSLKERSARAEAQIADTRAQSTASHEEAKASEARHDAVLQQSEEAFQKLKEESAQERLRQAEEHAKRLFDEVERIQQAAAQEHEELLSELEQRSANALTVGNDAVLRRLDEVESLVRTGADAPASILARLHDLEGTLRASSGADLMDRLDEIESLVRTGADAPASILGRLHELERTLSSDSGPDIMARLGELEVLAQGHAQALAALEKGSSREQHLIDRLVIALERVDEEAPEQHGDRLRAALEDEATSEPERMPREHTRPGWDKTLPDMKAAPPRDLIGRARVGLQPLLAPELRFTGVVALGAVLLLGTLLGLLIAPGPAETPPAVVAETPIPKTAPARPDWREGITQDMMRAVVEKRWADAAHLGTHLDPVFERDADALFVWADALRKAEQLEAAVTAYRRLMTQAPAHPSLSEAKLRIANLLVRLDHLDEGLAAYRAIATDPENRFRGRAAAAVQQLSARMAARAAGKEPASDDGEPFDADGEPDDSLD